MTDKSSVGALDSRLMVDKSSVGATGSRLMKAKSSVGALGTRLMNAGFRYLSGGLTLRNDSDVNYEYQITDDGYEEFDAGLYDLDRQIHMDTPPPLSEFSNAFKTLIKENTRRLNFLESSGSHIHSHLNSPLFHGSNLKVHDLFVTLLDLRQRYRESVGDEIISHLLGTVHRISAEESVSLT